MAIQPRTGNSGNEELRTVGIGTAVSHGQQTRTSVLQIKVFISKAITVDRFATTAVSVSEITTLQMKNEYYVKIKSNNLPGT